MTHRYDRPAKSSTHSKLNRASAAVIDRLEARSLFSVSVADLPTVEATWVVPALKFQGRTIPHAVSGSFNVLVRPGTDFSTLAASAGFVGVKSLGDGFYTFRTTGPVARVERWAARAGGAVEAISPVVAVHTARVVNDTYYTQAQWHLNNTGQLNPAVGLTPDSELDGPRVTGTVGADVSAQRAWDITTGRTDGIVAILDTGIDVGHGDLAANIWVNPGEIAGDGIDNDGNGYVDDVNGYDIADGDADITDTQGHGTAVAGVVAAVGDNAKGVAGIAFSTKLLGLKMFETATESTVSFTSSLVEAFNYLIDIKRRGQNVLAANASIGYGSLNFDTVLAAGLKRLTDAGIVFVGSAGNQSTNNDTIFRFTDRYAGGVLLPGVITAAATTNRDELADFSNFGPSTVLVAAPGENIYTTYSRFATGASLIDDAGDAYVNISGTSFAAPLTAGIVALVRSVAPDLTPAQVVQAVVDGVDKVPGLAGLTSGARPPVKSAGRVNAYGAIRAALNTSSASNTTLQGNWRGVYGSNGSFVYGGTTGTPSLPFLTSSLTPAGSSVVEAARAKPGDTRLSQVPVGDSRSAFYLTSPQAMGFNFDFGTTTRRLTLYAADIERLGRTQTVQVVDTDTGRVIRSVAMSSLRDGQYLSLDLTGRTTVNLLPGRRGDAILNAMYVDPAPTTGSRLLSVEAGPAGNWAGSYGDRGHLLPGALTSLPSFATVTSMGILASTSTSSRNTLLPINPATGQRSAGVLTSSGPFDINVTLTGTDSRRVAFYSYNTGSQPRSQRVTLVDANGAPVTSAEVTIPGRSGRYVTLRLSPGDSTVRFQSLGGGDASVAGVFFSNDSAAVGNGETSAVLLGTDTTTGGRWRGAFGTAGQYVVGASTSFPSNLISSSPVAVGGSPFTRVLNGNTNARNALQNPNTLQGSILAVTGTQSTTEVTVTLAEGQLSTRMAAYFVDPDRSSRVQQVEVVDAATNEVLSSVRLRDFRNGTYLSWEITGSVKLRITRIEGPNAVFSGIFFE